MKENDRLPLVRSGSQVVNAEPAGRSELRGDAVEMADRIAWLCDEEIHNSLLALSRERDSRGSQRILVDLARFQRPKAGFTVSIIGVFNWPDQLMELLFELFMCQLIFRGQVRISDEKVP